MLVHSAIDVSLRGLEAMVGGDKDAGETDAVMISRLVNVVEEFRRIDPKMELSQLLVFLLAVSRPGVKMSDLTGMTGLSRSAVSRNVLALSEKHYLTDEKGNPLPGRDLVTQVSDPFDARSKMVAPTQRGRGVAKRVASILKGVLHGKATWE